VGRRYLTNVLLRYPQPPYLPVQLLLRWVRPTLILRDYRAIDSRYKLGYNLISCSSLVLETGRRSYVLLVLGKRSHLTTKRIVIIHPDTAAIERLANAAQAVGGFDATSLDPQTTGTTLFLLDGAILYHSEN
jgi:hypothetical protein